MKKGIDVSTIQGDIDWSVVDVDFAMLKATQGRGETKATERLRIFTDSKFRRNAENASERGIDIGCYHYFTARNLDEALYEAKHFCRVIEPYRSKLKLWAAVDIESARWLEGVSRKELSTAASTFCKYITNEGFRPMLYTNPNFIRYRFEELPDADIWLAHWNTPRPMQIDRMKIWQYGVDTVNGVGMCDVNIGWFDDPAANFEIETNQVIRVGEKYALKQGDKYSNGKAVPRRLIGQDFLIKQIAEGKILLDEINSWVLI